MEAHKLESIAARQPVGVDILHGFKKTRALGILLFLSLDALVSYF